MVVGMVSRQEEWVQSHWALEEVHQQQEIQQEGKVGKAFAACLEAWGMAYSEVGRGDSLVEESWVRRLFETLMS